jgi:hypothetical protein
MNIRKIVNRSMAGSAFAACTLFATLAYADGAVATPSLVGTWTLVAADVQHPDGSRTNDYGAAPKGMLIIDAQGHYSVQIFKSERPKFASGDRAKGTPEEYKAASLGSSTHFGTVSVDPSTGTLTFHLQNASFPNFEGDTQKRSYELKDGQLSYRVAPLSVWQRVN